MEVVKQVINWAAVIAWISIASFYALFIILDLIDLFVRKKRKLRKSKPTKLRYINTPDHVQVRRIVPERMPNQYSTNMIN
jgi:hypothetical protein